MSPGIVKSVPANHLSGSWKYIVMICVTILCQRLVAIENKILSVCVDLKTTAASKGAIYSG